MADKFAHKIDCYGDDFIIGFHNDDDKINLLTLEQMQQLREMGLRVAGRFRPVETGYIVYSATYQIAKLIPIPNTNWFYDDIGNIVDIIPSADETYSNLQLIEITCRCPYQFDEGPFVGFQCWRTGFGDHAHVDATIATTLPKNVIPWGYLPAVSSPQIDCDVFMEKQAMYIKSVHRNIVQDCLNQIASQVPHFSGSNTLRFNYTRPPTCPLSYDDIQRIIRNYFTKQFKKTGIDKISGRLGFDGPSSVYIFIERKSSSN
jgi:hypothetical protein